MRISASCHYACKALLELALHLPSKELLQIHTISEKQGIPLNYLVQILIQLKRLGLVESLRGKEGGYLLAKPPSKITLGEVVREIGGPLLPTATSSVKTDAVFAKIWQDVEEAMATVLDKITFEEIANSVKDTNGVLIYQI